jgi:hypothetical protein
MILITEIKTLETELDVAQVTKLAYDSQIECLQFGKEMVDKKYITEIIHGRRFVHPKRGIDVVLGVTNEVGEKLGLMYECWNDMVAASMRTREVNIAMFKELDKIYNYGFWKRLKCLFVGFEESPSMAKESSAPEK